MPKKSRGQRQPSRLLPLIAVVVGVVIVLAGAGFGWSSAYALRFSPGITIGSVPVGGQTYVEALQRVRARADTFLDQGLKLQAGEHTATLEPMVGSQDGTSYFLYDADVEVSVQAAYQHLVSAPQPIRLLRQLRARVWGQAVTLATTFDASAFRKALQEEFGPDTTPAVNARFTIATPSLAVSVEPERSGFTFDLDAATRRATQQVARLDPAPIVLASVADHPTVTARDATAAASLARTAIQRAPFTLKFEDKTYPVSPAVLAGALIPVRQHNQVTVAVDATLLDAWFTDVATAIELPVQEGRFRMEAGRVIEFSESRTGRELDRTATTAALTAALLAGETSVDVAVRDVQPIFTSDTAATLGITELVAEGKTNFAGSPTNRRFNIQVGADKLNGLLVQPGETFSLLTALGPIDGKHGFRQELVIKGDRTIPEFGGGLCQIGTTSFRLVLNAGLPVVERANHSYRVRYYEPPVGMDATIYEPKPDFRFTNDYATPLLLTTAVEGNDVIFQFYGTKDERTVAMTTPRVFNIKAAPPKKIIETTDLKPGEEKCLEHAHPGSDAEFTYTVTYADVHTNVQTFKSHYRPWQELCLVGVKEKPKTTTTPQ